MASNGPVFRLRIGYLRLGTRTLEGTLVRTVFHRVADGLSDDTHKDDVRFMAQRPCEPS